MSQRDDEKGLMNERLPAPTTATGDTPRERTADHLKRLLAAASLAIGGAAHADVTPPNTTQPGKNGPQTDHGTKPPDPPPQRYRVVDPIPPPHLDRDGDLGFLDLSSTPSNAEITVDGVASDLRTPQKKLKLTPGIHAITLSLKKQSLETSFTVEIASKKTLHQTQTLHPVKKPDGKPEPK